MLEFHDAVELYRKAAEQADQNDPVNHPSHYASGGIECIVPALHAIPLYQAASSQEKKDA